MEHYDKGGNRVGGDTRPEPSERRCKHGFLCIIVPVPILGRGWVRPVAKACILCNEAIARDPDEAMLPFLEGQGIP